MTSCEGVEGFRYSYDANVHPQKENRHCGIILGSVLWKIKHSEVSIFHVCTAPARQLLIQQKAVCACMCVRSDEILTVGVFSWLELGVSVIHKRQ